MPCSRHVSTHHGAQKDDKRLYSRCSHSSSPYVFRWYVLSFFFAGGQGVQLYTAYRAHDYGWWTWKSQPLQLLIQPWRPRTPKKVTCTTFRAEKSPGPFRNFRERAGFCKNYTHQLAERYERTWTLHSST